MILFLSLWVIMYVYSVSENMSVVMIEQDDLNNKEALLD